MEKIRLRSFALPKSGPTAHVSARRGGADARWRYARHRPERWTGQGPKPTAAAIEREEPATYVQVQTVQTVQHVPSVSAMGRVTAEKQVMIQPEVAGRVIEQNHALTRGGRVAAGDPLLRIDPRDYSSALEAMQADLAQARLAMREEKALRQVAEHEWRERPEGLSEETLDYALREPHLDAAEARVKSVKSRIARARRDLSRTILRAPFDAIVLSESVDLGQTVAPQTPVARLVRREVDVVLSERSDVIVRGGLEVGEKVVVTPLPEATEGMRVTLAPDREDAEE